MANHALAALESALRDRKLDRTLTTALPPLERVDPSALVPMDVAALDACLRGGFRAASCRNWPGRARRGG